MEETKSETNQKTYWVTIFCYAPMGNTIPVDANTPDEAADRVRKELTSVRDIVVLQVGEEYPSDPQQLVEDHLNPTPNVLN